MPKKGNKEKRSKKRKKLSRTHTIQTALIIIVGVLLIGAVIAWIKLMAWNEGAESQYDPNEVNHEFDTETEDYLLPISSQMAELQKDDGVNSILLFGNGFVAKGRGEKDGMASLIEKYTGGKVYDASVDHSYISVKNVGFDESYPTDLFSLYWIVQCMKINDYTPLINHAREWEGDENIVETVEMLKNLDMSTIDTVFIMYDFHDYEDGRTIATIADDTGPLSVSACLNLSLKVFKEQFPHMRVVVSSPYFSYVENADGELVSGEKQDYGEGYLGDYMIAYKNVAVTNDASFIDNYFGSISVDNYKEYLQDDLKYPNKKGVELLARRAASFIGTADK